MSVYVSIDLDFWRRDFPEKFLRRLLDLGKPVKASIHHQYLLGHMNTYRYDEMINIDRHSDINKFSYNSNRYQLSCGNWGNFVAEKNKNDFIWVHPFKRIPVDSKKYKKLRYDGNEKQWPSGWKTYTERRRTLLTKREFENIRAIGICLSPSYLSDLASEIFPKKFSKLMKEYKVRIDRRGKG